MASAFASGFRMGTDAWDSAETAKRQKAADARAAEQHALQVKALGLQIGAQEQEAARQGELRALRTQMVDTASGLNRPATNAALDADFEAADQAQLAGLQMPAMRGGSNAANEAALAVRAPANPNDPTFRSTMSGLRARYALTAGDMQGYDAVTEAERRRLESADDAAFAQSVIKDPTGAEASQARAFINDRSGRLSSKVDPKTGMTTFVVTKGDSFDTISVSPADLAKLAVGTKRLMRGDVGGLDVIASVNKDLAAAAVQDFRLQLDAGKTNNDAVGTAGRLDLGNRELAANTAYRNASLGIQNARLGMDRMGSAQYFQGADGNTYAAVPTMGKNGLQFETVRVNPDGVGLVMPTRGAGGAGGRPVEDKKVNEPGTLMKRADGSTYRVGPNGEERDLKAIEPELRPQLYKKLDLPSYADEKLVWGQDGRYAAYGADAQGRPVLFDMSNKDDLAALKRRMEADASGAVAAHELQMREAAGERAREESRARERAIGQNNIDPSRVPEMAMRQNAAELARLREQRGLNK